MSDTTETIHLVRPFVKYFPKYSPNDLCFYMSMDHWHLLEGLYTRVRSSNKTLTNFVGGAMEGLPEGVTFGFKDAEKDAKLAEWLGVDPCVVVGEVQDGPSDPVGPDLDETVTLSRRKLRSDKQQGVNRRGRPAKYPFNQMKLVGDSFLVRGGKPANVRASGHQFLTTYQLADEWVIKYLDHPEGVLVVLFSTTGNEAVNEVDVNDD